MRNLVTAAAMLALVGGVAHAQTASETTTSQSTTYPAAPPPPPGYMAPAPGTLSVTKTEKSTDGYGNSYNSQSSTYRDQNGGVAQDSRTTTTNVVPPPPPMTTTTTTTNSSTTQPQ